MPSRPLTAPWSRTGVTSPSSLQLSLSGQVPLSHLPVQAPMSLLPQTGPSARILALLLEPDGPRPAAGLEVGAALRWVRQS
jgi:hypothetical protein